MDPNAGYNAQPPQYMGQNPQGAVQYDQNSQMQPPNQYPPGQAPNQYPPGQAPPNQYLPGQAPPNQYPPGQAPNQFPPGQAPPNQYPPGQAPNQFPPGQAPPNQYPPGQAPPNQYPPGQAPPYQHPPGQAPNQFPPGQAPPNQYPPGQAPNQFPPGQAPSPYPPGQAPPNQYPPSGQAPPNQQYGTFENDAAPWQPGQGAPPVWDNMPSKPPPEDPNAVAPEMLPVPYDNLPQFEGYGQMGVAIAPTAPPLMPTGEAPPQNFDGVSSLSEEECREALLEYVAEHCCYGSGAAKNLEVQQIAPSTALHYILETYAESRKTEYESEPYRGGAVDGPQFGMPPDPWSIASQCSGFFVDEDKKFEVPHTASVIPCNSCFGMGYVRCHMCHGHGHNRCHHCGGDGHVTKQNAEGESYHDECFVCHGDGRKRCLSCHGHGSITCRKCQGFRQLKTFIQLTVSYINHKEDFIMEESEMPDELIRDVKGELIFEQTFPAVWPITAYPVKSINENSVRLVEQHRAAFSNERQLQQRQTLRAVPVSEVLYKYSDNLSKFWVFGQEHKVHAPDYPQTCCWGCTIL